MKQKMMIHFALYFILAALFLIIVNVLYMESAVYSNEVLYYYDPLPLWEALEENVQSNPISIEASFQDKLIEENIGLQIIDANDNEMLRVNLAADNIPRKYSLVDIVKLYKSENSTIFIKELKLDSEDYTLILFMPPDEVGRTLYTYDVDLLKKTYNPLWLISMNVVLQKRAKSPLLQWWDG